MKKITKYVANDSTEFNTIEDCTAYESECLAIESVIMRLPEIPDIPGCGFANGAGYIQHNEALFTSVRKQLLELAKHHTSHKWIQESIDDPKIHPSYAGRIIDDFSFRPLVKAWHRIMCTDKHYREWGQPYYAANPEKAEQIKLN